MAARIRDEVPGSEVEIVPGGRGDFIVDAESTRLWDKRNMGFDFPDEDDMIARIKGLS